MVSSNKKTNMTIQTNTGLISTGPNASNIVEIHQHYPTTLNRTLLFDFCEKIISMGIGYEEYEITIATNFDDKIEYNEIELYKEIFYECDFYLEEAELVLEEIPKRQLILQKINNIYKKQKKFCPGECKDKLCENVYNILFNQIKDDQNSSSLIIEEVEQSIHLIMYYSFTKCKLLDPIQKEAT